MLKKFVSICCALALIMVLAVPVFAATDGQANTDTAQSLAEQIKQNPANPALASALSTKLKNDKSIVVDASITDAMRLAIANSGGKTQDINTEAGRVVAEYPQSVGKEVTVSDVKVENDSIVLTAQFEDGAQSALGVVVTIFLKDKLDASRTYMWECNGQTGFASVEDYTGDPFHQSKVSFYAPHFSTYTISAVNAAPNEPAPPSATVLANTAGDMSFALLGIVALGALVLAGTAVSLRKNARG